MYRPNLNILGLGPIGLGYRRARRNAITFATVRMVQRLHKLPIPQYRVVRTSGYWWFGMPRPTWPILRFASR